MAVTTGQAEAGEDEVFAAINTTPLVDVMLVLLIIFLITIPVVTHSLAVSLPKESNHPRQTKPENINISVTRDGSVYWNAFKLSKEELAAHLKLISLLEPQPELQIHGDGAAHYESIGRVVYACQRFGIRKLGFITEPQARH